MKCSGETNIEGLRSPSKYLAKPNAREELFIISENYFGKERDRLLNLGWQADLKGSKKNNHYYKAANIYIYLSYLVTIYYNKLNTAGLISSCNTDKQKEIYDLCCVNKALECLSAKYGTPYLKLFKEVLSELEITPEDCSCCQGIGSLIIEGNDCNALIVGACSGEEANCELLEFNEGEFPCEEFN